MKHHRIIVGLASLLEPVLPPPIKAVAKQVYTSLTKYQSEEDLHSEYVDAFFASQGEYDRLTNEFQEGQAADLRGRALKEYERLTGSDGLYGDVGLETAADYYAIVRKTEPSIVVETGVCNGVSTLGVLLAMEQNESGRLYSIDYPFRADESLEEFRAETFEDYGGASIPADKDPGWIIPDELQDRWKLTIGKSQRELPRLVAEIDQIDLFIHDSEHSFPCMMFEYELAYEWLRNGGVLLSDDISWNEAFVTFVRLRDAESGQISHNVGYIIKR